MPVRLTPTAPGDKDASVPLGALEQCGMCHFTGSGWSVYAFGDEVQL